MALDPNSSSYCTWLIIQKGFVLFNTHLLTTVYATVPTDKTINLWGFIESKEIALLPK